MKLSKKNAAVVQKTLNGWVSEGVIAPEEHQRLLKHIVIQPFDWRRLAGYAFIGALACLATAVASLFADSILIAWISQFLRFDAPVISVISAAIAVAFYYWGFRRYHLNPDKIYSNEAVLFLGVLFTATSLGYLGIWLDNGSGRVSLLLLFGAGIYALIGWLGRSPLVWLFALLSLGNAFGAETGYLSGWGAYWLGLNYPLRFILFGLILISVVLLAQNPLRQRRLERISQAMGLLYLFLALWLLSIFGNYGDIDGWYQVRQIELFHWSLLFALAAGAAIWLGLKRDDAMLRGFGLTFLAINLYTRFFELFWDSLPKTLFFVMLGGSLWLLGRYAEKIWRLGHSDTDVTH
ncbi:DUF2157 domain-containing protein [Yersinia nurmii]|uniref:DUF2157 domain-containing protein n=1 Tax=Yersinia nurmii TaxID=685706 RepID=A0AAW7JZ87_9GAMM|nr:DUF2157 domain-containing protein [Yersinia nurmii]MDN0087588.1 DUF2157 domain-containing protein [Yersinia nurmii]